MAKMSVVIITLNEERNIGRCLRSVEGLTDDIVVVDSGSTDLTAEICKSYGVRFFTTPWLGYAETKNYGNSLAIHPLILSLDADEALSDELRKSIMQVLKDQKAAAYSMNRLTNYCGHWIRHCGWYPDKKVRLFNNDAAFWSGSHIHETIKFTNGTQVLHLNGDILHYSYYSIAEHVAQANKFTDLTAKKAFEENKKASLLNVLFSPPVKFLRDYFLKAGFLDGYYGFVVCRISAFATFMKYSKLRRMRAEGKSKNPLNLRENDETTSPTSF